MWWKMQHIGWFMLLGMALAACNQHDDDHVEMWRAASLQFDVFSNLSAIDSLMWRQPDSALAVLQQFAASPQADSLDELNGHYFQLLISELLYKNYYDQSNREELLQAVVYFDSLCLYKGIARNISTIAFLDARAHYINGVGYYERDSVVEACKEYLKALEVMEGRFEEKELAGNKAIFVALTCTRLTDLYADDFLQEQALYFGKLSLKYYQKYDAQPSYIAWMLDELGGIYDIMGQWDSAYYYYRCAMDILPDTINLSYRDIATKQAFLSYKKDHQPEKSLALLYRLAQLAESDRELLARYLVIGDIYYYEKLFDSAWVYLKQVYDNTSAPDSKMLAAERLQEFSIKNGDTLKARKYALARSQSVTAKDEDGKLHSTLTGLCQQYEQNKQETQHKLKVQKATRRWGAVLGIVLALAAVVSVFLTMSKKRNQRLQTENEDVSRLLETERHAHKMQQSSLSNRLKRSNEELRELKDQIRQQADSMNTKQEAQALSFNDEPICRLIMERVNDGQFKAKIDCEIYKQYALDKQQLLDLRVAADRHFTQFTIRLRNAYPRLTSIDIDYCCLNLLNLTHADISALMQRAYNTVVERDSKIQKVFDTEKPLHVFLMDIAQHYSSI
ncbi:MAG: hypothetical protein IJQ83_00365 [Bacteroidales bacterium]|nr:hypothetical protein [Bacteroidales bacterium]